MLSQPRRLELKSPKTQTTQTQMQTRVHACLHMQTYRDVYAHVNTRTHKAWYTMKTASERGKRL
jgi:hypothetical protein